MDLVEQNYSATLREHQQTRQGCLAGYKVHQREESDEKANKPQSIYEWGSSIRQFVYLFIRSSTGASGQQSLSWIDPACHSVVPRWADDVYNRIWN